MLPQPQRLLILRCCSHSPPGDLFACRSSYLTGKGWRGRTCRRTHNQRDDKPSWTCERYGSPQQGRDACPEAMPMPRSTLSSASKTSATPREGTEHDEGALSAARRHVTNDVVGSASSCPRFGGARGLADLGGDEPSDGAVVRSFHLLGLAASQNLHVGCPPVQTFSALEIKAVSGAIQSSLCRSTHCARHSCRGHDQGPVFSAN